MFFNKGPSSASEPLKKTSTPNPELLKRIKRALDRVDIFIHHMRIDLGGRHILMPHQLLNHADVYTVFEQVGCKTVPHGVATDAFRDARLAHGGFDRLLQTRFHNMMPSDFS